MIERTLHECPECHSKLRAIIHNEVVCVGIGCSYVYRKDAIKYRAEDKTFVELKRDFS
jgi:transcription initiation factor TFIIIB Brf1 subunit/transcription initiation factor TFIIB